MPRFPNDPPGIQYPSLEGVVDSQVNEVFRNIYDNLLWFRENIAGGTSDEKEQAPRDAVVPHQTTFVPSPGPGPGPVSSSDFLFDTHASRLNLYPLSDYSPGTEFYETDREPLYVINDFGGMKKWQYLAGEYRSILSDIPSDLGVYDTGYRFWDTEQGVAHRWDDDEWLSRLLGVASYSDSDESFLSLIRAGGSVLVPTSVEDDMVLGNVDWRGQLGSTLGNLGTGARLLARASGDWGGGIFTESASQIGGDSLNSGWGTSARVLALIPFGTTNLYSGPQVGSNQFYDWDLTGPGPWTQRSPGWGSLTGSSGSGLRCGLLHDSIVYLGIGSTPNSGPEMYSYTPATTAFVQLITVADVGGVSADDRFECITKYETGDLLYLGTASSRAQVYEYDIVADTTTKIAQGGTEFPDIDSIDADIVQSMSVIEGSTDYLYAVVRYALGTARDLNIFRYNIGAGSWGQVGGNGIGFDLSGDTTGDDYQNTSSLTAFGRFHFSVNNPNDSSEGQLWQNVDGNTSWTQIGGSGINGGPTGNFFALGSAPDGSILAGVIDTGGDVEVWNYTITSDPATGTWTQLYTFTSGGYDRIERLAVDGNGQVYVALGSGSGDGDVWTIGSFAGSGRAADMELYVTRPNASVLSLSQLWYANGDIGMGGELADGMFWDEDVRRMGILQTSPTRTLDVNGDDGWHLNPSSQPSSPAAGDQIINTDENDWFEWYDGAAWRPAVTGPSSADDEDVALFDGTTGRIIKSGGPLRDPLNYEWKPTTDLPMPDDPQLVFDSDDNVVVEVSYIGP